MDSKQSSLKNYQDMKGVFETAFEEGKTEGKLEGISEGKLEGKLEVKREIAKTMKNRGFPRDIISEATGLSYSEIEKL